MNTMSEHYEDSIKSLGGELGLAMADLSTLEREVSAAEEYRGKIAERVSALSNERSEIVSRRAGGKHGAEDGAALALIQADLEGLNPILQEAAGKVTEARAAYSAASARAQGLRLELVRTEALAARDALIAHADSLAEKLLETITALDAASQQAGGRGGRPAWGAPAALFKTLRGIAAARGEL